MKHLQLSLLIILSATTIGFAQETNDTLPDYLATIKNIAKDIEALKKDYPQLKNFFAKVNTYPESLSISYNYDCHRPTLQTGWTAGVPNPNKGGVWFYIDFHSPDSQDQIHTQPATIPLCLGDKKVSFLILEGKDTKSLSDAIFAILKKYKIVEC